VATLLNHGTAAAASAGLAPKRLVTLEVRGRKSGRVLLLPVVVADYQGERYLVAMLGGDANWVHNVRAAGGRAVLRHGQRENVLLEDVAPDQRAPILKRYLELAPGARAHFPAADRAAPLTEFERIAGEYPVFRIHRLPAAPR
jgi:deazaflavin-dependent oxidoreductase (nitroreductase family)